MKATKPLLLAILVLLGMIVSPVMAAQYTLTNMPLYEKQNTNFQGVYNMSYDASAEGYRIALMSFTIPQESQVDFTIYYGDGLTVLGSSENHHLDLFRTSTTVTLGGDSKTYTFIDTQPFYDFNFAGYAKDSEMENKTGFLVYSGNYGALDNDLAAFYEVQNIGVNTIYRIDATGTKPFDMFVTTGSPGDVAGGASKGIVETAQEWVQFALALGGLLLGVVMGMFAWLKFFFIDNLLMTVALYLAISMAYTAATSKNIFVFYKRFFSDQRKFFEFILSLWQALINIISSFRGIFRL